MAILTQFTAFRQKRFKNRQYVCLKLAKIMVIVLAPGLLDWKFWSSSSNFQYIDYTYVKAQSPQLDATLRQVTGFDGTPFWPRKNSSFVRKVFGHKLVFCPKSFRTNLYLPCHAGPEKRGRQKTCKKFGQSFIPKWLTNMYPALGLNLRRFKGSESRSN
jgi:hypothetical protein